MQCAASRDELGQSAGHSGRPRDGAGRGRPGRRGNELEATNPAIVVAELTIWAKPVRPSPVRNG